MSIDANERGRTYSVTFYAEPVIDALGPPAAAMLRPFLVDDLGDVWLMVVLLPSVGIWD